MANEDKKIPALTELDPPVAEDLLVVVDVDDFTDTEDGTSKRTTLQIIADWLASLVQTLTNKTLISPVLTTPQINDTSSDHQYIFAPSELTADQTVTLPLLTGNDEFVFKDHAATLTNKTLTSPVINTAISGTAILDEDDMVSDSATKVATQQSIKAYSDLKGIGLRRQAIINGNFDVWQRGTSFADPTDNASSYCADRWSYARTAWAAGIQLSRQDGTGVNGSRYCARFQRESGNSATTGMNFRSALETQDSIMFRGKKVTLSFYARKGANYSAASDILISRIITGKGTDQNLNSGFTTTTNDSQNNTVTASWQKFTHTISSAIAADITQIGYAFAITPVGTAGAADYVEITQVQLCAGSVALPFQPKSYEDELRACQRYCYGVTTTNSYQVVATGMGHDTNTALFSIFMPVTLRSDDPALTATPGDWKIWRGGTDMGDVTSIGVAASQQGGSIVILTTDVAATPLTAGDGYFLGADGTTSRKIIIDAEL